MCNTRAVFQTSLPDTSVNTKHAIFSGKYKQLGKKFQGKTTQTPPVNYWITNRQTHGDFYYPSQVCNSLSCLILARALVTIKSQLLTFHNTNIHLLKCNFRQTKLTSIKYPRNLNCVYQIISNFCFPGLLHLEFKPTHKGDHHQSTKAVHKDTQASYKHKTEMQSFAKKFSGSVRASRVQNNSIYFT